MSEEDALKENNLLFETSKLFNFIGMSEPLNKIYERNFTKEGG